MTTPYDSSENRMDLHAAAGLTHSSQRFSYLSLLRWEFGYILILLIWSLSGGSDALKLASDAYAIAFVLYIGILLATRIHQLDRTCTILLGFTAFFSLGNLTLNAGQENIGESLKILAIFLFFLAGTTTEADFLERAPGRLMVVLFVALPVAFSLRDLYGGSSFDPLDEISLSFFANRNNAILFAVVSSWTLMLGGARHWIVTLYLLACAIAFKTLGAMLAILLALYLVYLGFNVLRIVLLGSLAAAFVMLFGSELEVVTRATVAFTSLSRVMDQAGGLWGLGAMSYEEIYEAVGTSDISLIFRLKHWINLFTLYADGSLTQQLFGFGVTSSLRLTDLKLLPHNDYIRFFFELGPGMLACFIAMNVLIVRRMGIRFLSIPAIFLFIYFFSDNIVNNFLVMSLFYFLAGMFSRHIESSERYLSD
ncbi:hypothetical protein G3N58_00030 [Paraburkholderia sp. Ac-20342]|uniref:hypothetical protein n=1 Tax=Paraburkholderia sp. Ac-20342 TaxID=2703889 RepID=UPI00197D1CED|nr:hypothetical protein [Paraburkholderia sp. Ac-20342]MBN3845221.1 hypothetical protein [Paraburkholderia sp. Ac-20342]